MKNIQFTGLPPAGHMRWTARQKAAVVRAVLGGALSPADVYSRYMLSADELTAWQTAYKRGGVAGLMVKNRHCRVTPLAKSSRQKAG